MVKIHAPIHIQIYEREGTKWFFHGGNIFYNPHGISTDLESTLERNGLTKIKVLVELFRINGYRWRNPQIAKLNRLVQ
jgi:hypothetical protein